jgi:hypothetical protein
LDIFCEMPIQMSFFSVASFFLLISLYMLDMSPSCVANISAYSVVCL